MTDTVPQNTDLKFPLLPRSWHDLTLVFGNPLPYTDNKGVMHVSSAWESEYMVLFNTSVAVPRRVYCHRRLAPILSNIFDELSSLGLQDLIHSWDGCFNPRRIKGSNNFSSHTLGISVDINAATNPQGMSWFQNTLSTKTDERLVQLFVKHGMCWG